MFYCLKKTSYFKNLNTPERIKSLLNVSKVEWFLYEEVKALKKQFWKTSFFLLLKCYNLLYIKKPLIISPQNAQFTQYKYLIFSK